MIETIGWVGGGVLVLSLIQRDSRRLHCLNIVACALFVAYDVMRWLPSMLALDTALLLVSVRAIGASRQHQAPEVVGVAPCPRCSR